ncbi:MoaD/ThiS family protein [Candidatus Woesearchaeota archaeon]|nr:MoaD/ThiS family protein [Candidatus Woesearchaeota archaeon]
MNVNVFMERENKKIMVELDEFSSLKDLLNELKINPVTVIATRNDELIPENEKLKDYDEIKIMPVISGG